MSITMGAVVRFNPDFCTEGERKYFLLVLESYKDHKQCLVQYLNGETEIAPTETVSWDMVIPTGVNALDGFSIEQFEYNMAMGMTFDSAMQYGMTDIEF